MIQLHILQISVKTLMMRADFMKHVEYNLFTICSVIGWQELKKLSVPDWPNWSVYLKIFSEKNLGASDTRRLVIDTLLSYERILEYVTSVNN